MKSLFDKYQRSNMMAKGKNQDIRLEVNILFLYVQVIELKEYFKA
jgi:hypothetical protein